MKKTMIAVTLLSISLAYAGGNSYNVKLYRPTTVNGTQFKAGEMKVEIHDNKVVLKQGKTTAESDVKVESAKQKFYDTTVGYNSGDANPQEIQDIRLGGTTTILLFGKADGKFATSAGH
jgi:hypothetical protein